MDDAQLGLGFAADNAALLNFVGMLWALVLCVLTIRGRRIYAPLWVAPAALMFMALGYGYSEALSALGRAASNPNLGNASYHWREFDGLFRVMRDAADGLLAGAWLASWSALCLGVATCWRGERMAPRDVLRALGGSVCVAGLYVAGLGGLWATSLWVYFVPAPAVVGVVLAHVRGGRDGARALVGLGLMGAVGGVMIARYGLWFNAAPRQLYDTMTPTALMELDARFAAAIMPGATAVLVAGAGVGLGLERLERREAIGAVVGVALLCLGAFVLPWRAEQARAAYIKTVHPHLPMGLTPPQVTRWPIDSRLQGSLILRDGERGPELIGKDATTSVPAGCVGSPLPAGCRLGESGLWALVALDGRASAAPLTTLCQGALKEVNFLVGETLSRRLDVLAGQEPSAMQTVRLRCSGVSDWRPGQRLGTLVPEGYVDADQQEISILVRREDVLWWGKRVEAQQVPMSSDASTADLVGVVVVPGMTLQDVLRRCERFAPTPERCVVLVDDAPPEHHEEAHAHAHEQSRRVLWGRDVQPSEDAAAQHGRDAAELRGLSHEVIKRGVEAGIPEVKQCIAEMRARRLKEEEHYYLKRYEELEARGVVNVRFTIDEEGAVRVLALHYHVYGEDARFERCTRDAFHKLKFPRPLKGPMTVTYTLPLWMR